MSSPFRETFDRWLESMSRGDWDAVGEFVHPECVEEMPQTRERTRGWANMRAIVEAFPGSSGRAPATAQDVTLLEPEQRWAMTPAFTVVKVQGEHDRYTATMRARYPDGSYWHAIFLVALKDNKIWRITSYYAPEFDPPEWRAPYVERMEEPAG